jgi:RNA polymerase sigma factor (sigma-70 family)
MIDAREHFGLAAKIARESGKVKNGERIEDAEAFSDALFGLARAIQGFDPTRGNQFSTYAYYCIHNEVTRNRHRKIPCSGLSQDVPEDETDDYGYKYPPQMMVKKILEQYPEDNECNRLNKKVLVDHYIDGKVLSEIGNELGVGKERVRQRIEKAIEYIKENIVQNVH